MTFSSRHYRLKPDHSVELVEIRNEADLLRWCEEVWGDDDARRVAYTIVAPGVTVSTIFLGIDHSFSSRGPPVLFETMVFTDYGGEEQLRWSTFDEALAGHQQLVEKLTKQRDPYLGRIRIRNADKLKPSRRD